VCGAALPGTLDISCCPAPIAQIVSSSVAGASSRCGLCMFAERGAAQVPLQTWRVRMQAPRAGCGTSKRVQHALYADHARLCSACRKSMIPLGMTSPDVCASPAVSFQLKQCGALSR
jgi:hypothetical protein